MAHHAGNPVNWYLQVHQSRADDVIHLRKWPQIGVAFEGEHIWINGLDHAQIESAEVKSIPYKNIFYEQNGKLFAQHSRLPSLSLPGFLWSPILRAFKLELPQTPQHFEGIIAPVAMQLIEGDIEQPAFAQWVDIKVLEKYIQIAPQLRFQHLQWTLINPNAALIKGSPALPLPGETFWRMQDFLLPSGYQLQYPAFYHTIKNKLGEDNNHWFLWQNTHTVSIIPKSNFNGLSKGSVNKSMVDFI